MSHAPKAVVIGAGIAGIAGAIRLAMQGMQVTVYDKNPFPGGKLHAFERDGYHFDAGPSLFTEPANLQQLFELAGENMTEFFHYEAVPLACRYFYGDGTVVNAYTDRAQLVQEFNEKLGENPAAIHSYLDDAASAYGSIGKIFLDHSLHKRSTFWQRGIWKALKATRRQYLAGTLNDRNKRVFTNPKTVQLFNRYATYNGSDPYRAPGMLSMIPHLEFNDGVYYPAGGMISITRALYELALRKGVVFHLGTPVQRIICHGNQVMGVVANDENITADLVVSNADAWFTYQQLLGQPVAARKLLRQERSSSAMVFYWGMNKSFPQLDLHNIFFADNYPEEFQYLFRKKQVYPDPTIYINITSKMEPGIQAPHDRENWFVMVNAPADTGQDWAAWRDRYRDAVITKLTRLLGKDIQAHIATETFKDPVAIASDTATYMGSLYGTSSNSRMAAFLRHPNFSRKIKGLYFVGGSVHPGGGIPLCLRSAAIMADLVKADLSSRKRH